MLLVLGLPNSTSCTQEQDQLYQEFKCKTRSKTNEIYQEKLGIRSAKISKCLLALDSATDPTVKKKIENELVQARKMPKLTNEDLGYIVNGPFQSTFTKEKIMECFRRVGYVPFTRNALKSEYIRHELDEENQNKSAGIGKVVEEYCAAKDEVRDLGFKVDGIFDAHIKIAPVIRREEEEAKQVEALVNRKKAFSASGIYQNIGTMCVTSTAVLQAQRKQLESYA